MSGAWQFIFMHSYAFCNTPVLEKLTLQLSESPDKWMEMEGSYNITKQPFASKQLKIVEVKCEKFDGRVHKILMILSTYGIYIEQINIKRSMSSSEGFRSWTFLSSDSAHLTLRECSREEHD